MMWELDDGLTAAERECDDMGHLCVVYEYNAEDDDEASGAHCEWCGRDVDMDGWL